MYSTELYVFFAVFLLSVCSIATEMIVIEYLGKYVNNANFVSWTWCALFAYQ